MSSFAHICYSFSIKPKLYLKIVVVFFFKKLRLHFSMLSLGCSKNVCKHLYVKNTFLSPVISSILLILVLFNLSRFCFFHWGLLSRPLLIQVTLQKRKSISNAHYHFYRLHKHLGISRGVTQWGHLLTSKRKSLSTKLNSLFLFRVAIKIGIRWTCDQPCVPVYNTKKRTSFLREQFKYIIFLCSKISIYFCE